MRRLAIVALGTLALGAQPVFAACIPSTTTTSPGKNSVFASGTGLLLPLLSPTPVLTGTIAKGKKKSVLTVSATLGIAGQPIVFDMGVQVNGVPMSGAYAAGDCKYTGATYCMITENFWLDLDAAEAAHPGAFVGQLLQIALLGESQSMSYGDGCADGSFTAQLVRK